MTELGQQERDRSGAGLWGAWTKALGKPAFLVEGVATLVFVLLAVLGMGWVSNYAQAREGVVLPDPILALIQPTPLRWPTHLVTYAAVFGGLGYLAWKPGRLLMFWQAWGLMFVFRMTAMMLAPFEAPPGILPILDPLAQQAATTEPIVDDLFFSGHTATAFLFVLFARPLWLKVLFFGATALIALFILLQHVHYGIDIFCAPFFAYASYRIVVLLHPGDL